MRLQHQNIIRLVGYCYEIAHKVMEYNGQYVYAGVEERALCFEYLQGGSLDKFLSDECSGLGWHTRYKIIKGICEGLHYLHNGSKDPIYHLDLKPANILLDKDMVPKIGDFGLSRLFDSAQTCTTKGIIGTPGYMPPEYINRYQITNKFDVFSLGVIIIQVMIGCGGYLECGNMPRQEFIDLVHGNWEERLQVTNSSHTSHEINTCIELRCVDSDPVKRPTIAEIVDELNKIDNGKGSLPDQDNLQTTQSKQQRNSERGGAEESLVATTLELEVAEELKKKEQSIAKLADLVRQVAKERDDARDQLQQLHLLATAAPAPAAAARHVQRHRLRLQPRLLPRRPLLRPRHLRRQALQAQPRHAAALMLIL